LILCKYTRKIQAMGRPTKIIIYTFIYVAALISPLAAEIPRIDPAPWAAPIAASGQPLSLQGLIDASLYASGAGEEEIDAYRGRIDSLIAGLPLYLRSRNGELPPGESVLQYLHEKIFRRYSEPQTRIDHLLDTGTYNCVSSAVLYMLLAKSAGLEVEGVVTPDHAFCRVAVQGGGVDVETTNPHGYNPGQKREFQNAFGETGFSYVPPGNYRLRTSIGERELIGLILQNRISLLQREERIDLSVPLAVDRHALAGSERTLVEMRKEFINYASVLNQERRYTEALAFLDVVRRRWGAAEEYLEIIDTLLYNAAVIMSQDGREEEILAILDERRAGGDLTAPDYRAYRQLTGQRMIYNASRAGDTLEALGLLERLRSGDLLSSATYTEYLAVLHGMRAGEISSQKGDLAALRYLESLDDAILSDKRLRSAVSVYTHNAAAAVHNRFVELFRAENYTRAGEILEDGLSKLPGNKMLLEDIEILQKVRNQAVR
jgi:tetratricopeptide (TPR) repeat protein